MLNGSNQNHDHNHNHHHHHNIEVGPKLIFAFIVTLTVFLAELIGGYWTHSLALLSDAWHVLADAAALGLAWLAVQQSQKESSIKKTFGYYRFEVITAFINGLSLLLISVYILYEAVERMINPQVVKSKEMFIIAVVGLVANGLIALLLNSSAKDNLNVRSAFLHVMGDALASVGVIIGGLAMLKYQWFIVDPVISIIISLLIVKGAWRVTKEAFHILMEGTPDNISMPELVEAVEKIEGVTNVHDLHAWSISGQMGSLSMHVQIDCVDAENVLQEVNRLLREDFGIGHSTVQVERNCHRKGSLICDLKDAHQQVVACEHIH